eukprot:NODE_6161_length_265_cov_45.208333_g6078_i0.p2 GENE.NODE_6161_length_265_cov_45.208333_g6078_i0~~NODE_6161_length_265_cov_45.208333_g6078_i0.p2  ORF type:complete len:66 (+),score=19.76 NODE_6161_length_265_cov_45.208333_g6078_i0:28-198(+)
MGLFCFSLLFFAFLYFSLLCLWVRLFGGFLQNVHSKVVYELLNSGIVDELFCYTLW